MSFCTFQQLLRIVAGLLFLMASIVASLPSSGTSRPSTRLDRDFDSKTVAEFVERILEIMPGEDSNQLHVLVEEAIVNGEDGVVETVIDVLLNDHQEDSGNDATEQENLQDAVECGCCFATYPFEEMIQCPETHLFCSPCMNTHSSILLGSHNPDILCMDQSGCTAEISPSELRRCLPTKTIELWERVKQRRDLESAGLDNLLYCPFCDWACIISENDAGQILMCRNRKVCGVISCRWCKKLDHRPNMCEVDSKGKHHVDEAMSGALVRQCPGCKKPFIKETGCNKMKCPSANCGTYSCYICRQIIKGYDHFDQTIGTADRRSETCRLWDAVDERHAEDVRVAAERALKEYHLQNTKVDIKSVEGVEHPASTAVA
ncbi:hypothetical protein D9615_007703 [Tricholomella constricta]|uniref:RING-type domain-containing protein n=1 Tax=Tricholomella constricta TaxID=117010 RepID=A0A8H5H3U8_9AGAR|nr:hypothetical protein D9615_007703 [Tricholomella constricta]